MGIEYSGGMIVGAPADCIPYDEEDFEDSWLYYETLENKGIVSYSLWYDAGNDGQVWGFPIRDVVVDSKDFDLWLDEVRQKATEFEEITGVKAELIGMQDIY